MLPFPRAGSSRGRLGRGAAGVICIAAAFERTIVKYGNRGRRYVYLEAGRAAESLMLQAVALGLDTTMVGAFSDKKVSRFLRLGGSETPLSLIPVGRPQVQCELTG
jgi:SagB-type dehydrogenase family enzyme